MEKSFEIATKYCDDDDRLFVNDTFVLGNKAKTENLFKTVEQLQKKGIKIDGVGIQGHMGTLSTTTFDVNFKALNKIADRCRKLGVKLEVTELDMKAYENETMREPTLPQWLEVWQINKYQCLFRELRDNKDVVTSVTFWGVDDAHNAIISGAKPGKDVEFPMLFDVNSMPKQSFYAVCDF